MNVEKERELIRKIPYDYICDSWAEKMLLNVGKRAFSILSLMPPSLILPDIPFGSKNIQSKINCLLIAPSGTGKSSIAEKFENITYFPFRRRDISARDLQTRAVTMEILSLIIEDFSQFSEDYEKIKVTEGILGEESNVLQSNMRMELLGGVRAIGLLEGTPLDMEKYSKQLEGGLLSRCVLSLITLTAKQHSEIGDYINSKAGDSNYSKEITEKEELVIKYYGELLLIQEGKHEKFLPVVEYKIEKDFKEELGRKWKSLSEKLIAELGDKFFIRDLNYYYKFLVSSAFLNIYNRKTIEKEIGRDSDGKIKKGLILYPNKQDHELALKLMIQNMKYKWAIEKAITVNKRIKKLIDLKKLMDSNLNDSVKEILINISPYARILKNGI